MPARTLNWVGLDVGAPTDFTDVDNWLDVGT